MSVVRTYSDMVECNHCHSQEQDPKDWLRFQPRFLLSHQGGLGTGISSGAFNDIIRREAWDFCSAKCADNFRRHLLPTTHVDR